MNSFSFRKRILPSESPFYSRRFAEAVFKRLTSRSKALLLTSEPPREPAQVLREAYEQLPEEHKIAFLLAGGVPQLFRSHHQRTQSSPQEGRRPSLGRRTGGLLIPS